jgi:hypothetical protein
MHGSPLATVRRAGTVRRAKALSHLVQAPPGLGWSTHGSPLATVRRAGTVRRAEALPHVVEAPMGLGWSTHGSPRPTVRRAGTVRRAKALSHLVQAPPGLSISARYPPAVTEIIAEVKPAGLSSTPDLPPPCQPSTDCGRVLTRWATHDS